MPDLLATDELLSAVRDATAELTFNGRIDAHLSERTVRYYVTLRLVSPPVRRDGRSMWTRDHVNELIRIRRAQSQGTSLKDLDVRRPSRVSMDAVRMANSPVLRAEMLDLPAALPDHDDGWAVRVTGGITLTGFGVRHPTEEELESVREALAGLGAI
ncbi:MAG: MerR family transcriptional regulator [Actinomycetota bacterium]